jgi:hypothetical protein
MTVDEKTYKLLKHDYDKAVENGDEVINFIGTELLVDYVKYLLEYFEIELQYAL